MYFFQLFLDILRKIYEKFRSYKGFSWYVSEMFLENTLMNVVFWYVTHVVEHNYQ